MEHKIMARKTSKSSHVMPEKPFSVSPGKKTGCVGGKGEKKKKKVLDRLRGFRSR